MTSGGGILEALLEGEMVIPINSRSFPKTVGENWSMQRS